MGWGSFQLGYSGNADLEPGRCRRTDGKKWRCSRDAVAEQKYCERHMNRGRHRSRKHVEGQPGHAAKAMSAVVAAAATQPAALAGAGATAAGLTANQHQQPAKSYATGATDPCSLQYNRYYLLLYVCSKCFNTHGICLVLLLLAKYAFVKLVLN